MVATAAMISRGRAGRSRSAAAPRTRHAPILGRYSVRSGRRTEGKKTFATGASATGIQTIENAIAGHGLRRAVAAITAATSVATNVTPSVTVRTPGFTGITSGA